MSDEVKNNLVLTLDRILGVQRALFEICMEQVDSKDSRVEVAILYMSQAEDALEKLRK